MTRSHRQRYLIKGIRDLLKLGKLEQMVKWPDKNKRCQRCDEGKGTYCPYSVTQLEQMVKQLEKNNRCSRCNLSQHFTQERTSGREKNTPTIYTDGSTHEKQNRDPYIFKKTWRSIADFI